MPIDAKLACELVGLGIPEAAHDFESLAEMFPTILSRETDGQTDPNVLAELLIFLVKRQAVKVPRSEAAAIVESLAPGSHLCHVYRSPAALAELLAAFFKAGLERGQACWWLAPGPAEAEEVRERLGLLLPDLRGVAARGQLAVEDGGSVYLDAAGRMRRTDEILARWLEREREALDRGFSALRGAADTSVIRHPEDRLRLPEHERLSTQAAPRTRIIALCAYPVGLCAGAALLDVVGSHDEALIKSGRWWHALSDPVEKRAEALLLSEKGAVA